MYNENQLTEIIENFEAMYVVSENNLRNFQSGLISLNDLLSTKFRVPVAFTKLHSIEAAKDAQVPEYPRR